MPVTGLLQGNKAADEKTAAALESALRISVSLSLEEKQGIVQAYPGLSTEQLAEWQRIFDEEQIKFALQAPEHQTQLGSLAEQHRAEWPRLADIPPPQMPSRQEVGGQMTLAEGRIAGESSVSPANGVSRNAPCPCGSGKRYKNCCGTL
ncbi:MAG: hypothetical protein GY862_00850 [Gammaproteobacteria bacterium]|nr:hypothetical protein [Gammaproteobacteria bacterium]